MTIEALDHATVSTALIPPESQKPNFVALAKTFLDAVSTLDAELVGLAEGLTDPNVAIGVQLQNLARIVGAPIVGDEDVQRMFISTQILVNKSSGSPEELLAILQVLDPDLEYEELYPASFEVKTLFGQPLAFASAAAGQIFAAKMAGVGASFFHSLVAEEDTFAFSDTSAVQVDAARGFSDTTQLTGGQLAGVIKYQ